MAVGFTLETVLILLIFTAALFVLLVARNTIPVTLRAHTQAHGQTLDFTRKVQVSKATVVMYAPTNQLHRLTNTWHHHLYKSESHHV